ncbi:hypothetical protein KSP40_PGU010207 [Platanthera guangdongensis]|uniref:Uncharacterized protein n=1 Tax=Platanthera guangdongensis TaxID=2320717 RepID=A0ABR2MHE7_9ASPA
MELVLVYSDPIHLYWLVSGACTRRTPGSWESSTITIGSTGAAAEGGIGPIEGLSILNVLVPQLVPEHRQKLVLPYMRPSPDPSTPSSLPLTINLILNSSPSTTTPIILHMTSSRHKNTSQTFNMNESPRSKNKHMDSFPLITL